MLQEEISRYRTGNSSNDQTDYRQSVPWLSAIWRNPYEAYLFRIGSYHSSSVRILRLVLIRIVGFSHRTDKLYDLMLESNLLPDAWQRWRLTNTDDKKWNNACNHFTLYANEFDESTTARSAGFHANHVEEALADTIDQMANRTGRSVSQATSINEMKIKLAASEAALAAYRDANCSNTNTRFTGTAGTPSTKYCWTHGLCNHLGRNCNNQKRGRKEDATATNTLGGSRRNIHPTA